MDAARQQDTSRYCDGFIIFDKRLYYERKWWLQSLSSTICSILNANNETYVEPDISVICDNNKLTDEGCKDAPDWIIEIDFSTVSIDR